MSTARRSAPRTTTPSPEAGVAATAPRVTKRGLERRDRILEVAAEMFLAHGYDGVSIDDIVKVVGGSKTNVYSHFGGKEGLFAAVVEEMCGDFLDGLQGMEATDPDPAAGLRAIGRALVAVLLEARHVAFQRLVIAESGRFPAMARAWFEAGPQRARAVIARCIAFHQQAGRLRPADPARMATRFHDMIVTNGLYQALLGTPPAAQEREAAIDEAVATLLHGHAA
ncbi:TetR/AcrR family transcriptional regulator [Rhodovarius crocodyli]|uniref:TetR/AcrR family transcriptional regulator n=1 Tax=Rhodovarius crocodyli TaxID=1979269 RepID=A0A437MCE6_9PROT|nr:TetR/AcrR family transcriptional regulator [Rhodovarius crocodyli]RVT95307.1 TetR/AcrR family transcriptional regulator [Rhodovarius crocodyli]